MRSSQRVNVLYILTTRLTILRTHLLFALERARFTVFLVRHEGGAQIAPLRVRVTTSEHDCSVTTVILIVTAEHHHRRYIISCADGARCVFLRFSLAGRLSSWSRSSVRFLLRFAWQFQTRPNSIEWRFQTRPKSVERAPQLPTPCPYRG